MIDLTEEYDSQIQLVVEGYLELQKRQPGHELLELVTLHEDQSGFIMKEDFFERCLSEGFNLESPRLYAMGFYFSALDNAAKGLPYELPPKP
jgi:hypothetical protein